MTQQEMAQVMDIMHKEETEARAAGQKEYAHDLSRAFRNFEEVAKDLNMDRKIVLWVYLRKHMDGILAYLNGHRSQREDVRGRIKDARVYLALLRGMIEEEERFNGASLTITGSGSPTNGASWLPPAGPSTVYP